MSIMAYDCHPQNLTEEIFGIFTVCYSNSQVVETKVRPCALLVCCGRFRKGLCLDVKYLSVEVCRALANEHIGEDLISSWCAYTNAVSNQKSWR
jgi:hypothetical protein